MEIKFDLTGPEIQQLREVIDNLPLRTYAPLIVKVLKALPMETESMYLTGETERGRKGLASINARLASLLCPGSGE